MTLQRRVFSYVAAAAIVSCALTVLVGVVLVRDRIASQQLSALERQADVVAAVSVPRGTVDTGGHVYAVKNGRVRQLGPVRSAAVLAAIPASGNAQGRISLRGRSLLYIARVTPQGRFVLIGATSLAFAEWRPFLASLLLAGLGGALLAALCSYLLARRLTRPIAELSAATARVAAGEAGVEVPVEGEDELAELAGSFNAMSRELARAREAQRSFLESVSHELKTPLTSIRGYAEGVGEGAVSPAEGSAVIALEANRLERMVRDLLDLARFDRAEFSVAREPVDLAAIAARTVERHLPQARELSVTLVSTAADAAWGLGDEDRLLQATSNLVENALRLTPAGGSVTVHAAPRQLTVTDSGPGIAAQDLPRAFERFYLQERYRSERVVGSGLGLAIVAELAHAMGGTAAAASAPGGGAEFTIELLPVSEPARSAPGAVASGVQD
ncbi:MAG TPA: HAMP domain-containing sensor histidine kinase [Solirubrobacteraceae bacterium]|nr:HAMP domain-containing sensor histidine kinase [Solirubrobacteraceae bacterium]